MAKLGKWIFGGLGFVLGGPIGALLGVVLGSIFDRASELPVVNDPDDNGDGYGRQTRGQSAGGRRTYTRATQGDIKMSILVLVASVMKADGHPQKSELEVVKRFLRTNYSDEEAQQALQILKQLLQQDINHVAVAQQIRANLNYSTRLTLVQFLLSVANADGEFAPQEQFVVEQIALCMGVTSSDYDSLSAIYLTKKVDPNWAYQALEITPEASDEEVKKAYRRMAMKYHPDKVASAGDDIKQKATEKFRAVNEAYEIIKTARGIK